VRRCEAVKVAFGALDVFNEIFFGKFPGVDDA
jgi:hypothetical protein